MNISKNTLAIIVTYNGGLYIKNCISSILSSTFLVDILCIDNNSTDNTINIIESNFPTLTLIKASSNLGFGAANNIGIKYALRNNYDFMLLLNQDVILNVDSISNLMQSKKIALSNILSPSQLNLDSTDWDYRFKHYIGPKLVKLLDINEPYMDPIPLRFANAAAWLLSKEVVHKVGLFDPIFFHYGEDEDYINRALYHNIRVMLVHNSKIRHLREESIETTVQKRTNSVLFRCYEITKDINHNYILQLLRAVKHFISSFFKAIFEKNLPYFWQLFLSFIGFISLQPLVIKHRLISKKTSAFNSEI